MLAPHNGQVEKLSLPDINHFVFNFMMCEHPAVLKINRGFALISELLVGFLGIRPNTLTV